MSFLLVHNKLSHSSLKQHSFISSCSWGWCLTWHAGLSVQVIHSIGWSACLSGSSVEKPTPRLIIVISRIQFLVFIGLKSFFPCWLSAEYPSQFLKVTVFLLRWPFSLLNPQTSLTLSDFLFFPQRALD